MNRNEKLTQAEQELNEWLQNVADEINAPVETVESIYWKLCSIEKDKGSIFWQDIMWAGDKFDSRYGKSIAGKWMDNNEEYKKLYNALYILKNTKRVHVRDNIYKHEEYGEDFEYFLADY